MECLAYFNIMNYKLAAIDELHHAGNNSHVKGIGENYAQYCSRVSDPNLNAWLVLEGGNVEKSPH